MADDPDGLRALEDRIDDLARQGLDATREQARREGHGQAPPTLWVHVVHGTWANPAKALARPTWFEPGGSLETAMRAHGQADDWRPVRFAHVPPWSGANSFAARAAAAVRLSEHFRGVLFDPRTTFDRHVVVAHSHGGTVAAEALRRLGPLAAEFSGLLTLGTPFVERFRAVDPAVDPAANGAERGAIKGAVNGAADRAAAVSFDSLTGVCAHAVAFFFAFTLGLCFLFEGRLGPAAAWTVLGICPWALARSPRLRSMAEALNAAVPLAAFATFWWAFDVVGPASALGNLLLGAVLSLFVAVFLAPRLMVLRSVDFLGASDGLREDELPPPLKTELLAIRAPGDEASLAISAASAAVWVSESLSAVGFRTLGRIPGAVWAVLGLALLVTGAGAIAYPGHAAWTLAAGVAWSLPVMVPMGLLIGALLVKSAASVLIALACGPEALQAPGVMKVFAEPLPRSRDGLDAPATLRMVFPSAADLEALRLKGSLRHAIYDYPSVQRYVAAWILRHAACARSRE